MDGQIQMDGQYNVQTISIHAYIHTHTHYMHMFETSSMNHENAPKKRQLFTGLHSSPAHTHTHRLLVTLLGHVPSRKSISAAAPVNKKHWHMPC